jgi:hypothetical protein
VERRAISVEDVVIDHLAVPVSKLERRAIKLKDAIINLLGLR